MEDAAIKKLASRQSDIEVEHTDFPLARALSDEDRVTTEKSLKRKLDLRCSIFVLIYILSEWIVVSPNCADLRLPRQEQHRSSEVEGSAGRPQARRYAVCDVSVNVSWRSPPLGGSWRLY